MALKTHRDDPPGMNMTPMIDVVFLLLIFFLVGTRLADSERQMELRVPEVAENAAMTDRPKPKIVTIYADGQIELDHKPVTLTELTNRLASARSQYRDLGVLVRGDRSVSLQQAAEVLSACKQSGIAEMAISVRLKDARR